jgi:hypothetical protein
VSCSNQYFLKHKKITCYWGLNSRPHTC